jgi:hypothetical protein
VKFSNYPKPVLAATLAHLADRDIHSALDISETLEATLAEYRAQHPTPGGPRTGSGPKRGGKTQQGHYKCGYCKTIYAARYPACPVCGRGRSQR